MNGQKCPFLTSPLEEKLARSTTYDEYALDDMIWLGCEETGAAEAKEEEEDLQRLHGSYEIVVMNHTIGSHRLAIPAQEDRLVFPKDEGEFEVKTAEALEDERSIMEGSVTLPLPPRGERKRTDLGFEFGMSQLQSYFWNSQLLGQGYELWIPNMPYGKPFCEGGHALLFQLREAAVALRRDDKVGPGCVLLNDPRTDGYREVKAEMEAYRRANAISWLCAEKGVPEPIAIIIRDFWRNLPPPFLFLRRGDLIFSTRMDDRWGYDYESLVAARPVSKNTLK